MQVVRLLEPRARTWSAKLVEAWRALQLEWRLSKNDILQLYLTYAPYGGNVEGISAAAYVYFGHAPRHLTYGQAAFLYLLPQSPSRWHYYHSNQWQQARWRILQRLADCGVMTDKQAIQSARSPLPKSRKPFPRHASHFATYLRRHYPTARRFKTTIAIDIQRFIEQTAKRHDNALTADSIHNIALIVADNASRSVRAIIGNFDDLALEHGQNIASFDVPRSPGSTLKPFLYALALDQGKILPETLLLDVPTVYQQYAPGNFSGTFSGLVAAQTALSQSLNIPFVRLLQQIGVAQFLSFLELGGLEIASAREHLGLSMIIGGIEITPLQMLQLYTHLANGGRAARLRFLTVSEAYESIPLSKNSSHPFATSRRRGQNSPTLSATNWLSPGAVHLTDIALAKRDRPDFPQRKNFATYTANIRWKTGTSQGRRDAWSIGYDDQHTVLVWLGNLNQDASMALTGANSAAPIMFEVLEGLHRRQRDQVAPSSSPVQHLVKVEACAFSGDRASRFCPLTKPVWGVRDRVPTHVCRFHQRILRDIHSGLRVLRGCDQGLNTELASVLNLPGQVFRWVQQIDPRQTLLPPFHPQCRYLPVANGSLQIRSPQQGAHYLMLPSFGQSILHLPLLVDGSSQQTNMSCFLNGHQIDHGQSDVRYYLSLSPGEFYLFCSTADGASDAVYFEVTTPASLPRLPM
jgi:penicillin-binding protein 1C